MSSIFTSRRKQHRPVPITNDYDPWSMRSDDSSDDTQASTSKTTTAVRIMSTVRRFSYNSPRKRERGHLESERGMYSTPAESSPPTPSAFSFHDRPDTRPTIEQIAMGLHISRTPHLLSPRQSSQAPHTHHLSRRSVDVSPGRSPLRPDLPSRRTSLPASASGFTILPPPPARSSLKKTARPPTAESATLAPSASDASLSTLTSNGPSTPRSVRSAPATSFPGKLRLEMLRLLPSRKGSLSGSSSSRSDSPGVMTASSDADSLSSGVGLTPRRKAVRFSTNVHEEQEA
ncbi:hypothetical protein V8D89_009683 [Ganoderma adspersum]